MRGTGCHGWLWRLRRRVHVRVSTGRGSAKPGRRSSRPACIRNRGRLAAIGPADVRRRIPGQPRLRQGLRRHHPPRPHRRRRLHRPARPRAHHAAPARSPAPRTRMDDPVHRHLRPTPHRPDQPRPGHSTRVADTAHRFSHQTTNHGQAARTASDETATPLQQAITRNGISRSTPYRPVDRGLAKVDLWLLSTFSTIYGRSVVQFASVTVLHHDGQLVAGIGCSCATYEEDGLCADSARDAGLSQIGS